MIEIKRACTCCGSDNAALAAEPLRLHLHCNCRPLADMTSLVLCSHLGLVSLKHVKLIPGFGSASRGTCDVCCIFDKSVRALCRANSQQVSLCLQVVCAVGWTPGLPMCRTVKGMRPLALSSAASCVGLAGPRARSRSSAIPQIAGCGSA